jgi:hypothetical protein
VPALTLAACGGQDDFERPTDARPTAATAAATPTSTPEPVATSTPDRRTAKTHRTSSPQRTARSYVACDANIEVKAATTTCPFAQNTFYEYWYAWNYSEMDSFAAYSAAAGKWLDMTCLGASRVTCEARDGSVVRFPMSAVRAYTVDAAERYAAKMTVSAAPGDADAAPAPEPDSEPEDTEPEGDGGGSEDPYTTTPYDRDCADFPETDFSTPPGDPDGLDADGDGIACES